MSGDSYTADVLKATEARWGRAVNVALTALERNRPKLARVAFREAKIAAETARICTILLSDREKAASWATKRGWPDFWLPGMCAGALEVAGRQLGEEVAGLPGPVRASLEASGIDEALRERYRQARYRAKWRPRLSSCWPGEHRVRRERDRLRLVDPGVG
jgi:hypothetical protein